MHTLGLGPTLHPDEFDRPLDIKSSAKGDTKSEQLHQTSFPTYQIYWVPRDGSPSREKLFPETPGAGEFQSLVALTTNPTARLGYR
jgi:hypothetical protein